MTNGKPEKPTLVCPCFYRSRRESVFVCMSNHSRSAIDNRQKSRYRPSPYASGSSDSSCSSCSDKRGIGPRLDSNCIKKNVYVLFYGVVKELQIQGYINYKIASKGSYSQGIAHPNVCQSFSKLSSSSSLADMFSSISSNIS